jgi:pimeloyl-ACP methyl ester carboxylesterase
MDLSESGGRVLDPGCSLGMTRLSAEGSGIGPVLVLEASDRSLDGFLPLLRRNFDACLVHAPRRADPRRYGLPLEHGHWFVGPPEAPDPHGLYNALAALEDLLVRLRAPQALAPVLVGSGGGATLALALASCWGDRLRAVVAIGGVLPALPEEVERASIEGLPILWLSEPTPERRAGNPFSNELAARGAHVTRELPCPHETSPESLSNWLQASVSQAEAGCR